MGKKKATILKKENPRERIMYEQGKRFTRIKNLLQMAIISDIDFELCIINKDNNTITRSSNLNKQAFQQVVDGLKRKKADFFDEVYNKNEYGRLFEKGLKTNYTEQAIKTANNTVKKPRIRRTKKEIEEERRKMALYQTANKENENDDDDNEEDNDSEEKEEPKNIFTAVQIKEETFKVKSPVFNFKKYRFY